jgi:hypothetical protein
MNRYYIDVLGKDLGMEETRRGGESAKKYLRGVLGETPGKNTRGIG